jgi:ERCC4-related helicase
VKLHGNGSDRMDDWNNHRMFFTTPQVRQHLLQSCYTITYDDVTTVQTPTCHRRSKQAVHYCTVNWQQLVVGCCQVKVATMHAK